MWLRNWRSSSQIIYYHIIIFRFTDETNKRAVNEDGGHGELDALRDTSFPCNGEVGDLAVDARVVCGYDTSLLEGHCAACAGRVSCEDGVGSVVCLWAASAGVACLRPEYVGVDVPQVVGDVGGRAAVRLVPVALEVDELMRSWLLYVEMLKCNRILFLKLWRSLCVQNRP